MNAIACLCGSLPRLSKLILACPRRGCSMMRPVYRELMTEEEAIQAWNNQARKMWQPMLEGQMFLWMEPATKMDHHVTVVRDGMDGWVDVTRGPVNELAAKKDLYPIEA